VKIPLSEITIPRHRLRSLDPAAVQSLAESINEIGLINPITLTKERVIVAGVHRFRACKSLGWTEIPATILGVEGFAQQLVEIDENLRRNDLTVLERSEHLELRKVAYEGLHPETKKGGDRGNQHTGGKARDPRSASPFTADTAKATGISRRVVQEEVQIASRLSPEVREAIRGTEMADSKVDLLALARQPAPLQATIAERVASGEAGSVREAVREVRRQERLDTLAGISAGNKPLSDTKGGPWPVLYADPPWRYEHCESESRAIENQYPTMTLKEICALPVPGICTPDAILFLWATSPKLAEALEVVAAWGFIYRTCAVWTKPQIGMGYYFRQQHELLLVATRGSPPTPPPEARLPSVFHADRGAHSAKPEALRLAIEAMYPTLPRVEMFARAASKGWATWGNQA
jgi:N6-adenosine-specific RNA methylase IME4